MSESQVRSNCDPSPILLVILGLLGAGFVAVTTFYDLVHKACYQPQACTVDHGVTISYFKVPSSINTRKFRKVYPGEEEYEKILKSKDFTYTDIPPNEKKEVSNSPGPTRKCRAFSIVIM